MGCSCLIVRVSLISSLVLSHQTQVRGDGQFKQIAAKEPSREKQYLDIFDLPGFWVEPSDDLVTEFLRFLFGIGRRLIYVENVSLTIVLKC